MTTKKIIFSDKTSAFMTFEQVVEQFDKLIDKYSYQVTGQIKGLEYSDVRQEMLLAAWKAYNKYDNTSNISFSTYLFYWLKHAKSKIISHELAEKRIKMDVVSINKSTGFSEDDGEFLDFFEAEDNSIERAEFDCDYQKITDLLTEEEKVLFLIFLYPDEWTGARVGKHWGISRQAVNKKVIAFRKKLRKLMKEMGYLENTQWENFNEK